MTVSLKDPGQCFGFTDGLAQPGFVIFSMTACDNDRYTRRKVKTHKNFCINTFCQETDNKETPCVSYNMHAFEFIRVQQLDLKRML